MTSTASWRGTRNPGFQPFGFAGGLNDADGRTLHSVRETTMRARGGGCSLIRLGRQVTAIDSYAGIDGINNTDASGLCLEDLCILEISLEDTGLDQLKMVPASVQRSAEDWYETFLRDGKWQGAGGAENLEDLLREFLEWAGQ